jgi:hypothetical protein
MAKSSFFSAAAAMTTFSSFGVFFGVLFILVTAPSLLAFGPHATTLRRPLHSSSSSSTFLLASQKQQPQPPQQKQPQQQQRRYPASTVTDPHGSTPFIEPDPFPEIDINTYPEMHYDPNNHPVKHQPWRRGDTDGCHDPISAPWRLEAQDIITDAVSLVGGTVVDVTWYMAKCVISIDEKCLSINSKNGSPIVNYVDGPEVRIVYPDESDVIGHIWDDTSSTSSTTNSNNDDGTTGTTDRYGNFVMEEMYTEEDELLEYEQYDEDTDIAVAAMQQQEEETIQ